VPTRRRSRYAYGLCPTTSKRQGFTRSTDSVGRRVEGLATRPQPRRPADGSKLPSKAPEWPYAGYPSVTTARKPAEIRHSRTLGKPHAVTTVFCVPQKASATAWRSAIDRSPSRQQPAARSIEGEEITTASYGLIFCTTDRHAFQVAEQERPNAAMR
jgi:hypothetical protein